jgi:hypothetical protein
MVPYTYLLHHKPTNTFYYGVRWAKDCKPEEFWKTYFTRSKKLVPLFRTLYGNDSFEFEIRKIFSSGREAREWEQKVLRRMKVLKKPDLWLNRTDNKAIYNEISPTLGRVVPEEQKERQRQKMMGNTNGKYAKGRVAWNKGVPATEEKRQFLIGLCKDRIPWNKGKKGLQVAWNKGMRKVS